MMDRTIATVSLDELHAHSRNPRLDAAQVDDLVESIKVHGVEVPLVAAPDADGGYVVLAGHRRLTAAHALQLESVPVDVRTDLTDPREQLAFMATENMHRDQLTAIEESRLFQDMLDLGWTQATVARHTAVKRSRVSERLKLGKLSEETGAKVHRGQISIDHALVIAEFSADPESAAELEKAVGTFGWDWQVSRVRARRDAAKQRAAAVKTIEKAGGRLVDEDADFIALEELWNEGAFRPDSLADAEDFAEALRTAHESCPGHSARAEARGPVWGCDQVDEQHQTLDGATSETAQAGAAAADPWDEFTAEDLAAARIFREARIAEALTTVDLEATARESLTATLLDIAAAPADSYRGGQAETLRRVLGAGTVSEAEAAMRRLPLAVLAFLGSNRFAEVLRVSTFRGEDEFKNGWVWDAEHGDVFDGVLQLLGVDPSDVEKRAWALKNGRPWGTPAPTNAAGDEDVAGDEA